MSAFDVEQIPERNADLFALDIGFDKNGGFAGSGIFVHGPVFLYRRQEAFVAEGLELLVEHIMFIGFGAVLAKGGGQDHAGMKRYRPRQLDSG